MKKQVLAILAIAFVLVGLGAAPALATDVLSTTTDTNHGSHTYYSPSNRNLTVYDVLPDGYGGYTFMIYASDATGHCPDYAGYNTSNTCNQKGQPSGKFGFYDCLENGGGATKFNCDTYKWSSLP